MTTEMSINPSVVYSTNFHNVVTLEKDPDSPKLFLGQIPIGVNESQLRSVLEVYGPLANIVIMEPKNGVDSMCYCAVKYGFVTYVHKKDAEMAIAAINEKLTFPNSKGCVQMRPAEGEGSAAGVKLFISHIPLTVDSGHLSVIFSSYGKVEESKILLTNNGKSKGCGFVRMSNLQDSVRALEAINSNCKIEGQQIRAYFAETAKEKKYRKKLTNSNMSPYPAVRNNMLTVSQPPVYCNPYQYASYGVNPLYNIPANEQIFPIQRDASTTPKLIYSLNQFNSLYANLVNSQAAAHAKMPTYNNLEPPVPSRRMGPNGANLYIYHIPFDWNSSNLWDVFVRIGPLVNAYVATDKVTGKNRGFGFISYKAPEFAQKALSTLNGKSFLGKKIFLKIQKF